jgi:hypothetical protein
MLSFEIKPYVSFRPIELEEFIVAEIKLLSQHALTIKFFMHLYLHSRVNINLLLLTHNNYLEASLRLQQSLYHIQR